MRNSRKNTQEKINELIKVMGKLINNDPDPSIKRFCTIAIDEPVFFDTAKKVFDRRPCLEEEHFVFLFFVCLQYLTSFSYDGIAIEKNNKLREKIKGDYERHIDEIIEYCTTRNVSTNIPERYVGLQIIASLLFQSEKHPLTIVDIGCSLGLGLMALNSDFFCEAVKVEECLIEHTKKSPDFNRVVGIDVQKPELEWVLASYLPESRKKRLLFQNRYNTLKINQDRIKIIQGNALNLQEIPSLLPGIADIVWISNTCYQIEGNIENVIRGIGWLLKNDGLWLYAYYRYDIEREIKPDTNPYVISAFIKNDLWIERLSKGAQKFREHGLEVLEAPDEQVDTIISGRDFSRFCERRLIAN